MFTKKSSPQEHKKLAYKMLRQTEGTLKKALKMMDDNKYCIDIIQQIRSMNGMLEKASSEMLQSHLHGCLEFKLKEDKEQTIEELVKIYQFKK